MTTPTPRQDSLGPTATPQQILLLSGMTHKREALERELHNATRKRQRMARAGLLGCWVGIGSSVLGVVTALVEGPTLFAAVLWPLQSAVLFGLHACRITKEQP